MARGWESKSVDEQQAEKFSDRAPAFVPPSAAEQEREGLLLQRKRILLAIEGSKNPRYIEQQQKALAFLDDRLKSLS